ncbi:MAG: hypothetical protein AAF495_13030 [Pseudomonadota bacterium]
MLVIGMGVAIFVVLAIIIVTVAQRVSGPSESDQASFGALDVPLPAGCSLAEASLSGERLVLRYNGPGPAGQGCQQVLIVDLASGQVLGSVTAKPAP